MDLGTSYIKRSSLLLRIKNTIIRKEIGSDLGNEIGIIKHIKVSLFTRTTVGLPLLCGRTLTGLPPNRCPSVVGGFVALARRPSGLANEGPTNTKSRIQTPI